jgi:Icc-related predicted phosphoesterase
VITPEQAKLAIAGGPANVLLTHDAPTGALPTLVGMLTRYDPYTLQSARHVQEVAEATKPKLLLHGHWHQFQQVRLPGQETEVIGLSTDGTRKSWLVLDLPGLEITHEAESAGLAM